MGRSSWQRGCVSLVAAALLAVAVSCPLGGLAIWRGVLSPPRFDQFVGPLRVIGYSTWNANCPPYNGCDPTLHESYVVWLIVDRAAPGRDGPRAYRLVRLPIAHAP